MSQLTSQTDRLALPWPTLLADIHPEPLRLVTGKFDGHSFWHLARASNPLAIGTVASGLRGQLVWLHQVRKLGTSHQNQLDPQTNPIRFLVYSKLASSTSCRASSIRSTLHRATVRVQEHLAGQERLLLRLWLPQCRQRHLGYHDKRGDDRHDVRAAVQRKLSLVVAELFGGRG